MVVKTVYQWALWKAGKLDMLKVELMVGLKANLSVDQKVFRMVLQMEQRKASMMVEQKADPLVVMMVVTKDSRKVARKAGQ